MNTTPQTMEERFDIFRKKHGITTTPGEMKAFITSEIQAERHKVLNIIAQSEGWEEPKKHYAKILGISLTEIE